MKLNKITVLTGLAMLASTQAFSHGYVESPESRNFMCKQGNNTDCGRSRYEPQSVEAADFQFNSSTGEPLSLLNNNIGSAGVTGFEALDEQEQSRWAKTAVRPGEPLDIKWQFTANHKSKTFDFYITKPNWDPDKLLTRDSFESTPLNCYNPQPAWVAPNQPPMDGLTFTCTMPQRAGYQVIMAVWDVDDTAASFYNLIDLDFTNDVPAGTIIKPDGSSSGDTDSSDTPIYDSSKTYRDSGIRVVYEGSIYESKWYVNPGQEPGELYGPWKLIGKDENNSPVNPNDNYPDQIGQLNINPDSFSAGDKIGLFIFPDSQQEYELMTVEKGMTSADIINILTNKINELSKSKFNEKFMAGIKSTSGSIANSSDDLKIYQTANKPFTEIGITHQLADHNLKNMLHLMDLKETYTTDRNGDLNLNAKIMSHGSKETNVSVVLQNKNGEAVKRQNNIMIEPMATYDLAWKIENLPVGQYKLIFSSEMTGAEAWQKALDINVEGNDSDDTNTGADKNASVDISSNIPFYQVNKNDTVTPRSWYADLGTINFGNEQVRIMPWSKASQASGNSTSDYVNCPKPSNGQDDITYIVSGNLNSVTCKIKDN
ncbi:lytic polysaccharide monooxygenase [Francisella adeliensis]|uniref:Chitin-binding protein n=1 Tax=Francisella adeliensis TaxID=2007306 RepID=A0A2Z4XZR5_9GAMM|nr:lytic polysaccharide monooxygenase [Francisella adeliensis]AXA34138.1 chitin-binding protein [Francisella adeliensis]MBK2085306.1 lytic polysaccharide monooxygenase [Francisella adeliensis]MBK2095926.1 lytic polysaccharide monooxygenase [Francisella adeliensis]QIW12380.1 chitin-binding protein [Francisella adeliensis]QIW14254.1 chitin-binding protein [Francisella adeliensis]